MFTLLNKICLTGFTNRPKDDILTSCEEKGFAIIIELVVVPNTGEWRLTTGTRWVSLFFLFLVCIILSVLRRL